MKLHTEDEGDISMHSTEWNSVSKY